MLQKPEKHDIANALVKGTVGMVPVFGSLISELLSTTLPDKRYERLEALVFALNAKLDEQEEANVRAELAKPDALDVLEEGLHQAARAISEDRKKQIAALVGNALEDRRLQYIEHKRLLGLLGELNDLEIKILYAYSHETSVERQAYLNAHPDVDGPRGPLGAPEYERKKELFESYLAHLVQLRLLAPRYREPTLEGLRMTEVAEIAAKPPKIVDYDLSALGRLLLEAVDLIPREV